MRKWYTINEHNSYNRMMDKIIPQRNNQMIPLIIRRIEITTIVKQEKISTKNSNLSKFPINSDKWKKSIFKKERLE